jgi:Cdc6-like AAA superfamily ATPase
MDIDTRIRRRERLQDDRRLVVDYQALSPVAHVEEPPGRGPVLERVLDHLDPVFEGRKPPDGALWGPPGSGKSAVVTALFDRLRIRTEQSQSVVHTTTRAQSPDAPAFVYLDTRAASSRFQLYHDTLAALTDESVPEHGVSTEQLQSRLRSRLGGYSSAVVAVDHVGEPQTLSAAEVREQFEPFGSQLSLLTVSRSPPDAWPVETIEIPGYGQQVLIDVLMTRSSEGLTSDAFTHRQARTLASWASGNAHDALAALFGAADAAAAENRDQLTEADLQAGMDHVPERCVSLGWVLTLPENRQLVLYELLQLPDAAGRSVTEITDALADRPAIDLSAGTIRRFLYELAEDGIVERVQTERKHDQGRPPSRIEPRFPTRVFERLYEIQN